MAKLKGPLFSLGATQQLGKALVYFPWKGLDLVREYVVPANPKTDAQNTQRAYVTAAVAKIHEVQGAASNPLDAEDIMAYALWASTFATPRTWFNQAVKDWIDRRVAGGQGCIFNDGHLTPGTDKLTFVLRASRAGPQDVTNGTIYYGTTKTALINTLAATKAELIAGKDITSLTTGVKYFAQFRPLLHSSYLGYRSGIYYGVPT